MLSGVTSPQQRLHPWRAKASALCAGTAVAACWQRVPFAQSKRVAGQQTQYPCCLSLTPPVSALPGSLYCVQTSLASGFVARRQSSHSHECPQLPMERLGAQPARVCTCSHCMVGDIDRKAFEAADSSPDGLRCAAEMGCSRALPSSGWRRRPPPAMGACVCSSAAWASTGLMHPTARPGDSMKDAERRAGSRTRRPPRCDSNCSSAETARVDTLTPQHAHSALLALAFNTSCSCNQQTQNSLLYTSAQQSAVDLRVQCTYPAQRVSMPHQMHIEGARALRSAMSICKKKAHLSRSDSSFVSGTPLLKVAPSSRGLEADSGCAAAAGKLSPLRKQLFLRWAWPDRANSYR
jgi:hypothetical protein